TASGRPITFVNPPGFVLRECESDERRADLMRTRVGEKSKDLAAAGERLVGNKSAARARQAVHLCKLGDKLIRRVLKPPNRVLEILSN
ncbi:hypothetical protein J6590_096772, partial [Homalodisca vitripennis]